MDPTYNRDEIAKDPLLTPVSETHAEIPRKQSNVVLGLGPKRDQEPLDDKRGPAIDPDALRLAREFLAEPAKREAAIRAVEYEVGPKTAAALREAVVVSRELVRLSTAPSATHDTVSVPRSLAERSEAMFRSVDPEGCIAQEWKSALADSTGLPTKE